MVCAFSRVCVSLLTCGAALPRASTPNTTDSDVALPDVDTILSEATATVATLTKTAEKMEKAMNHTQSHHQEELLRLRESYTARLAEQDRANERVVLYNTKLKQGLDSLSVSNQLIRKSALLLQETNKGMRSMLAAFKPKFSAADAFLVASMNASEAPLHAKELQVLQEPLPTPTLENFLKALASGDRKHSLIQIAGQRAAARREGAELVTAEMMNHAKVVAAETAEAIVDSLSKRIENIGKAQEEGDNKLKAEFLANFEARQLKQDQLLVEQAELNVTRETAMKEQHELYDAKKALLSVNADLARRMQGISTFAQTTHEFVKEQIAKAKAELKTSGVQKGSTHKTKH